MTAQLLLTADAAPVAPEHTHCNKADWYNQCVPYSMCVSDRNLATALCTAGILYLSLPYCILHTRNHTHQKAPLPSPHTTLTTHANHQ